METKLQRLTALKQELDATLRAYQQNHALWAKWLHHAKSQTWYDDWCYQQAMRQSDLKADPRYVAKDQRDVKPELAYSMGAIYYSERHSYHTRLENLRLQRGKLLHDLWSERDSDGNWVYSLRQIAEAYGNSDDAMYKKLVANDWFFTRRSPKQTHIPKKYLKKS